MPQQPSYTVPPSRKPSFINTGAVKGAAIGMLGAVLFPPAPAIGAVIGSVVRRSKMKQEEQFGKVVHPPTTWNSGTFVGSALGLGTGILMAGLILGIGAGLGILSGGAALPALGTLLWSGAGVAAFTAISGWVGNKISQHFQKKEYQKAENFAMQHGEFIPPAERQQAIAMGQALAPTGPAPMQTPAIPAGNLAQASTQLNSADVDALRAQAARGQQMALEEMLTRQAAGGQQQGRFAQQVQTVRPVTVGAGRS